MSESTAMPQPKAKGTVHSTNNAPRHDTLREQLDIPDDGLSASLSKNLAMLKLTSSGPASASLQGSAGHRQLKTSTFGSSNMEGLSGKQEGPSLMDQMVAEATTAHVEDANEKRKQRRERTKKDFGKGLRKGFLSKPSCTQNGNGGNKSKSAGKGHSNDICVAKSGVSLGLASGKGSTRTENMSLVRDRQAASGGVDFDISGEKGGSNTGIVIPEVQEAMRKNASPAGGAVDLQWLTPELLDKISQRPRLADMLTDPRFGKAMQVMSKSPQEAMSLFASNPEAQETFTELSALLAEHFTTIGKAADARAAKDEADRQRVAEGPLAQEALRRAASGNSTVAKPPSKEEQTNVEKILENPELRELLVDPDMQKVLQECSTPADLARYMRHPEYGPKLQLMARAGLVSFQS